MNGISNGKMVKRCLKVSILFKTDILPKYFASHNALLVISNHTYVEVFFWVPTTSTYVYVYSVKRFLQTSQTFIFILLS